MMLLCVLTVILVIASWLSENIELKTSLLIFALLTFVMWLVYL